MVGFFDFFWKGGICVRSGVLGWEVIGYFGRGASI